ncbi:hypothetical protein NUSPORA_01902 [Nucleospora cyclopteri]
MSVADTKEELNKKYNAMQIKTFTNWVNNKLKRKGFSQTTSLFEGLKDGKILHNLLYALNQKPPKITENPTLKIQLMENMQKIIEYIKEDLKIKLINIGSEDIVYGNEKLILGLIWTLIYNLSIEQGFYHELKQEILEWAKSVTQGYENVKVTNFTSSFADGLAFNAIIHFHRADLIDISCLSKENKRENLEQAFRVAEESLGIGRLLDVNDVLSFDVPDEKSIFTYIMEFFIKFKDFKQRTLSRNLLTEILIDQNRKVAEEIKIKNEQNEFKTELSFYYEEKEKILIAMGNLVKNIKNIISCKKSLLRKSLKLSEDACNYEMLCISSNLKSDQTISEFSTEFLNFVIKEDFAVPELYEVIEQCDCSDFTHIFQSKMSLEDLFCKKLKSYREFKLLEENSAGFGQLSVKNDKELLEIHEMIRNLIETHEFTKMEGKISKYNKISSEIEGKDEISRKTMSILDKKEIERLDLLKNLVAGPEDLKESFSTLLKSTLLIKLLPKSSIDSLFEYLNMEELKVSDFLNEKLENIGEIVTKREIEEMLDQ